MRLAGAIRTAAPPALACMLALMLSAGCSGPHSSDSVWGLLLGTASIAAARPPSVAPGTEDTANWNKRIANFTPRSVASDSSGNVYVVGYGMNLVSGTSGPDWWIKKFSSTGIEDTVNWNKKISSAGATSDYAYSAVVDTAGNLYVAGSGEALVSGTSGYDIWIKKFSSTGVEDTANWNKAFTGAGTNLDAAYSIAVDSAGNLFVAGTGYNLLGSTSEDWWIKKFSSTGTEDTVNWTKKFSSAGANADVAYSVAVDSSGNVYVAGRGNNLVSGTSLWDWWIKKFSNAGTEDTSNWNKKFDGGNNPNVQSIAVDASGNVYVGGYGQNLVDGASVADMWIKKFSSGGTEDTSNWNKIFSYPGGGTNEVAMCLKIDSGNNVYVIGYGYGPTGGSTNGWIKKFSGAGTEDSTLWNKVVDLGGAEYAYGASLDSSGDLYVAGTGFNLFGTGTEDAWIKKYRGQ